jgi:hypothetical protein
VFDSACWAALLSGFWQAVGPGSDKNRASIALELLSGLAASALSACSSPGFQFDEPEMPDISGTYNYEAYLAGTRDGRRVSCIGRGHLTIERSGPSFVGTVSSTGQCSGRPGAGSRYAHSNSLTRASIDGTAT